MCSDRANGSGVPSRDRVIEIARSQLGVPFAHQGHAPGVRLDCGGVVTTVAAAVGVEHSIPPAYSLRPGRARLVHIFDRYLAHPRAGLANPLPGADDLRPGSVALFRMTRRPVDSHCGVIGYWDTPNGRELTLIHSYKPAGRVVEVPFDAFWLGLLLKVYDFPGVEGCRWPL